MKKRLFSILWLLVVLHPAKGQTAIERITGQVSFRSSQHTYVRFRNTAGINTGDTLFIQAGDTLEPALVVSSLSSTSCLCKPLSSTELPEGSVIIAEIRKPGTPENKEKISAGEATPVSDRRSTASVKSAPPSGQVFKGSVSAASYSHFSNSKYNQRFRYRLTGNAANIGGSAISARASMTYTHRLNDAIGNGRIQPLRLKIYDLWLKYDIDSTASVRMGRQINSRLVSTGAFDGLVAEKTYGRFTGGITAGTTPDHLDYGFNPRLLQFGGYAAYDVYDKAYTSSTSLAFMEHLNSGKTDRRYIYFQHSGSVGRSITYFGSAEADLFRSSDRQGSAFTSAWLMMSLRLTQKISVNGSYDARKNPVWHESYRTLADSLIEAGMRQSLNLGTNINLNRQVSGGLRTSARFMKTDNRSGNISGYVTWRNVMNNVSATLTGNYIETGFLNGMHGGVMLRSYGEKLQAGAGYTFQRYSIGEGGLPVIQHTGRTDLSWKLHLKTFLNADYEIALNEGNIFHSFYVQLSRRF
jgi:hypothetical protein